MKKEKTWLGLKLDRLTEQCNQISKIDGGVYYKVGPWSALKLIFLLSYLGGVYTKIIPNWYEKMYYIDLLAGAGVVQIKDSNDLVLGSPIIAAIWAQKPFTKMLLVEKNPESAKALENRLEWIKTQPNFKPIDFKVYKGQDSNEVIGDIVSNLYGKSHYLGFVDSEGLEINWHTVETLLKKDGDIIFNFQTSEVGRVWGAAKSDEAISRKMTSFYGGKEWASAGDINDLLEIYENKIRKYRPIVMDIKIKGFLKYSYHYHLIFATKKTQKGSPWSRAVEHMKNKIESYTGDATKVALDVLMGRARDLSWFVQEEEGDKGFKTLMDFK